MKVSPRDQISGMGCSYMLLSKTGDQTCVAYGRWESEEKMQSAMPEMISLLDRSRHLLEELSSELGFTDPVSGAVVFEA